MSVAENDVQRQLEGVRREVREGEVNRPKPLPWLGKRLLLLSIASGSAGYAFHLFGTWPLGIVAIVTPVIGWIALVLAMQRQFGASPQSTALCLEDDTCAKAISRTESNLAAQMDWRRRFGT